MKKVYISLIITMIFPILCYAQISWVSQNSGTTAGLDGVYFANENNGWVAGWGQIILHTTNGGNTWGLQNTPVSSLDCIFFTDSLNGWASGLSGDVIHTTNGGETWVSQGNLDYQDIFKLYFTDGNNGWAAGGFFDFLSGSYGRAIYNTTDGGENWNVQYDVTFETELKSIYFTNSSTGYAAGGTAVMKTTNGGSSWAVQHSFQGFSLEDIVFTDSTTGYAAGWYTGVPHYTSIFKTTDSGSSWSETSLGIDEDLSGLFFTGELNGWAVGQESGTGDVQALIYRTTDGGVNWVKQDIPAYNGLAQVFFVNDTKGWAVGSLGTILTTTGPVPVETEVNAPQKFYLDQNYPNPFNPATQIELSIPNEGFVSLKVYNALGQEAAVLVNGMMTAGRHVVTFDGANLASGVYYYRIEAGGKADVRKMVLVR